MKAEIITIGDELLIGQVVDTNSSWIGVQLTKMGVTVGYRTAIGDDRIEITKAVQSALGRVDIVLVTGGLGPTKDDITKLTLCEIFNTHLVFNETVYADVEALFKRLGKVVTPTNRKQAEVPASCKTIRNFQGTAPAMWFDLPENKVLVSMPGVPFEMKALMESQVLPMLKSRFTFPDIYQKTVLVQGIGESALSDMLTDWEDELTRAGLKLAYLPSLGRVRLRLTATGYDAAHNQQAVSSRIEKLQGLLGNYIYGYQEMGKQEPLLEEIVGKLLQARGATVGTVESCTGGFIAHLISSIAGCSAYYQGSIVSYANEIKQSLLDISPATIEANGTVSQAVVEAMAINGRTRLGVDYAIAASGVAGPGGGTEEKPVGTVWLALASSKGVVAKLCHFAGSREQNIRQTAETGLNMLRKALEEGHS